MDVSEGREHHSTGHRGRWELLHRPEGWAIWPPLARPAPERDPPQEVRGWICKQKTDPLAQKRWSTTFSRASGGWRDAGSLGGDHKSKGDVTQPC